MLVISACLMTLTYIVLICNAELHEHENKEEWIETVRKECGEEELKSAFHNRNISDTGPVVGGFGVYFGTLLHSKYLPGFTKFGRPTAEESCK